VSLKSLQFNLDCKNCISHFILDFYQIFSSILYPLEGVFVYVSVCLLISSLLVFLKFNSTMIDNCVAKGCVGLSYLSNFHFLPNWFQMFRLTRKNGKVIRFGNELFIASLNKSLYHYWSSFCLFLRSVIQAINRRP